MIILTVTKKFLLETLFSSFMCVHVQAMNEYRGGEMSTEVVVDRNLWTELWTVDGSEIVLQA